MRKTLLIFGGSAFLCAVLFTLACNVWVLQATRHRVFEHGLDVPPREVGLLLGTGRTTPHGYANPHFENRVCLAAELFRAGKIRRVLASGDNHVRGYDEPTDMKEALMAAGVPAEA